MEIAWLLYILVFFGNGEPKLDIQKYSTLQECESESIRVRKELAQVYDLTDAQIYCIPYERRYE